MVVPVLHPSQSQVNEAWIVFTLNESPIVTLRDGSYDCICLMDAASCYILANAMVRSSEREPSELEVRGLFKTAQAHNPRKPRRLFAQAGQPQARIVAEANRRGMEVIRAAESELLVFVGEARRGFKEHVTTPPAGEA
jgi:hypothetical protein